MTQDEIIELYTRQSIIIYAAIQFGFLLFLGGGIKYLEYGIANSTVAFNEPLSRSPSNLSVDASPPISRIASLDDILDVIDAESSPLLPYTPSHPHFIKRQNSLTNFLRSSRYKRFKKYLKGRNRRVTLVGVIGSLYSVVGEWGLILIG